MGNGLSIFIYLTKPDKKFGITEFVKRSHLHTIDNSFIAKNNGDDATYIDLGRSPFAVKDIIKTHGGIGTVVIFHRSIWHQLPKFTEPGREIIMIRYSNTEISSYDHLVKNSFLNLLSSIQKEVFLENKSNKNAPGLSKLGSNLDKADIYKIPDWKKILYYIRYKFFSKARS